MADGWNGLDLDGEHLKTLQAENEAKAREIASRFHECFRSEAGQYVLQRLREVTLDKPVLNGNSTQFSAGIREGQNNIVRQILEQIAMAEKI